jgi:transcriptional regulator with PAS, ATPase and Fis domain
MASFDSNSQSQSSAAVGLAKTRPEPDHATESFTEQPIAVPVLSLDLEGKVTGCSAAALELFGQFAQEILGRTLASLVSPTVSPTQWQKTFLATILRDGQFIALCQCLGESGKTIAMELSVTLLRDGRSASSGMVALFQVSQLGSVKDIPGRSHSPNPSAPRKSTDESANQESASSEAQDDQPHTVSRTIEGSTFVLASPIMHRFMRMVDRVAGHTETVLITGETGTGKELIARTIHHSSHRRSRAWVDINCAALPENLVESELFGYEKGAFTGADASKPGLFELADQGTLFLDEIGELQLQTQVKLLRVLDGYPFYRLGGHRKIKVDVRLVAATNQDLEAAVAGGRFREDLFHRLGQFQLRVPPLRERPEDIVALAEHFLKLKNPRAAFMPEAISALVSHAWPGNVRELRNLVARVAVQSTNSEILASQITAAMSGSPAALRQTASVPVGNLDSMEEQMIIRALERSGGHRGQAADQLGISRRTLSRKLKEYNINVTGSDKDKERDKDGADVLGTISLEQQKFFRARIQLAVTLKNQRGEEVQVQGVNLSTGGMGLDGLKEPMRFTGLLDVNFPLPETDHVFRAKARIVWMGDEGRVGLRFTVIDPILFEHLQHWTNKKMKDEGWDLPA